MSGANFPHFAARVFNTALVVHPGKASAILTGFGGKLGLAEVGPDLIGALSVGDAPQAVDGREVYAGVLDDELRGEIRSGRIDGYHMVQGVAVISVTGTLVHRGAYVGKSSGQRSYEGLISQVEAAHEDGRCRGVALEVDSFGGEVAGCAALAEAIRQCRVDKPVRAFIADHAYSAGYWIASQADQIVVSRTSGVGSIGVIWMHVDHSEAATMSGVTVTPVFSGSHKADGHPYAPLPSDVRENIEAELGAMRQIFAEDVAAGRGSRLDVSAVLATEAATFVGAEAVASGLADRVGDLRAAFREFVAETNGQTLLPSTQLANGGQTMANGKNDTPLVDVTPAPAADATPAPAADATPAPAPVPVADATPAPAPVPAADATTAPDPLARAKAILQSPDAVGREGMANALAFDPKYAGLDLDGAAAMLALAPKGTVTGTLVGHMSSADTDLGVGADGSGTSDPSESIVAIHRERHSKAT